MHLLLPPQVIDGTMVKIYAWYEGGIFVGGCATGCALTPPETLNHLQPWYYRYDNEWGYSARLIDVAAMVAAALP